MLKSFFRKYNGFVGFTSVAILKSYLSTSRGALLNKGILEHSNGTLTEVLKKGGYQHSIWASLEIDVHFLDWKRTSYIHHLTSIYI